MSELRAAPSQRAGRRSVFISYSHKDREFIQTLERALAQAGHVVWDDQKVTPGVDWVAGIERAIEECEVAIIVLSPQSIQATTTNYEVGLLLRKAEQERIRLVPVLIAGLAVSKIPARLHRYNLLDARDKAPAEFLGELLTVMESL